jgi:L-glutamine:2-deoxy-scyllo-inosose/3-amino-2,3-dideoxy-scyllo-inosose aminotransferase
MTKKTSADKLALLGGKPVSPESIAPPAWPPTDEKTAAKLAELYLSRQWSFNSPTEQAFEKAFAKYHDAEHGIFMANGTVTLQCALEAMGIGRGDEVIVPALTWIATAMAVHYVGAKPVFVDIEPDTLCLDPKAAAAAITSKTAAIIPVHIYGSMANLDEILKLAKRHNLAVIEDCAHMQGGKWNQRGVGSHGHVGSFSFQQSKTLSSGEGGICLTHDAQLAEKIYRCKHIGYPPASRQGGAKSGPPQGLTCFNYRGTAFQALILREQLRKLKGLIARYNRSAERLTEALENSRGLRAQAPGKKASPQGYYAFVVLSDQSPLAEANPYLVRHAISLEGVATGGTYGPVYSHKLFNLRPGQYRIHEGSCPVAEGPAFEQVIVLNHQMLSAPASSIDRIAKILLKVERHAETLAGLDPDDFLK